MRGEQLILVAVIALVFALAGIMEWYKKTLRKGRASVLEIRLVSGALSLLSAVVLWFAFDWTQVLVLVRPPFILVLAALLWVLQKDACMTVVKKIAKALAEKQMR